MGRGGWLKLIGMCLKCAEFAAERKMAGAKVNPSYYISVRSSTGFEIIHSFDLVVERSGAVIFPLSAVAALALASFLLRAISSIDFVCNLASPRVSHS
jgi:hypothetical protein